MNYIPNCITSLRIILVVPLAYALIHQHFETALIIFIVAGLSDGVDGFLARRFNWQSRFGEIADPLADKLLMFVTLVSLLILEFVPLWLGGLVIIRDLIVIMGAAFYHILIGPYPFEPTLLGKATTASQITLIFMVLVQRVYPAMPDWIIYTLVITVVLLTLASGFDYVTTWWQKFRQARESQSG